MGTLLLSVFLAAHGLIHLSFVVPAPPRTADGPEWPFELGRTWPVTALHADPELTRIVGVGLVMGTVVVLVAAALATVGWLVPASMWGPLVVCGAALSLVTLTLFFHPWLVLGIVIDVVLLWAVVAAGWNPAEGRT
jgi:hypothetical protein